MANVLVRNLDDDVLKQLKAAAKAHGRSLQAEIHEVLRNASARRLAETRRLLKLPHEYVAPDLLFAETANTIWKKIRRKELTVEDGRQLVADMGRIAVE